MKHVLLILLFISSPAYARSDALPSWNDGPTKTAIITFVQQAVDEQSEHYVPVAERIAVFDNDGTLMGEKPVFLQGNFLAFLAESAMDTNPTYAQDADFKALVERENWQRYFETTPWEKTLKIYAATHTGMTQTAFTKMVKDYLRVHEQYRRTVYQPMRELLDYLRANGFKPYIVTGSENQFVRAFSEEYFGIPPEQVIGTSWKTEVQEVDGRIEIKRLPEFSFYNDKKSKVEAIDHYIGRVPVFAAGNDGNAGDIYMLRYATQDKERPGFGLIVAHDDGKREAAYTDKDGATLAAARTYGWTVAHVADDWKTIFPAVSNRNSVPAAR